MNIRKVTEIVIEQRPRQIGLSPDDWRALSLDLEKLTTRDRDGKFKRGGNADDHAYVTFRSGDDHAYVMGVMVFRDFNVKRDEMRVDR
jgi:hypothetical protein